MVVNGIITVERYLSNVDYKIEHRIALFIINA